MKKKDNSAKIIKDQYAQNPRGKVLDARYFYYDTSPDYNRDLAIVCGGYEKCASNFDINRSTYPYYFVKYTTRGKGRLEINSRRIELTAGSVSGFCPGTAHHYRADGQEPMEHIFVTFVGAEAERLLRAGSLYEAGAVRPLKSAEVLGVFEKIFDAGIEKGRYSQEICCNYLRILFLLLGQDSGQLKRNYSQSMATYFECKKYIDDNFSQLSSSQEVAEHCAINSRYMSSLFKRYCHTSPHEYVMRLKLNKAANLLLTSSLSVKEIAYQVGFEDPYHFSRNFKKIHSLPPREYRDFHS